MPLIRSRATARAIRATGHPCFRYIWRMPRRHRPARLRIALLALCTLLLSQWMLAAHACPKVAQAAAQIAEAQLAQELAGSAAAGCPLHARFAADPDRGAGEDGAFQPSVVCFKHCADESPASSSIAFGADAPPPAQALRIARPVADLGLPGAHRPNLSAATAPPLIIQYCVSLT